MRPQSSKRHFKLADLFDLVDDFFFFIKFTMHCQADMPCCQIQVLCRTLETYSSVKQRYQDQCGEEKINGNVLETIHFLLLGRGEGMWLRNTKIYLIPFPKAL